MKIFLFILATFAPFAFAGPAGCPTYTPPNSIPIPSTADGYLDISTFTNAQKCQTTATKVKANGYYYKDVVLGPFITGYQIILGPCQSFVPSIPAGHYLIGKYDYPPICPSGYSQSGTNCVLTNMSLVACPLCIPGDDAGTGPASTTLVCVNDCAVKPRGMTASEIDASGNQIGIKLAYWEKTGDQCTKMPTPPPTVTGINKANTNCIKNGERELCFNQSQPGCGTINGKEWCPDKVGCGTINGQRVCVPDDGGCTPSGGLDFACTKGATPPAPPAGEPPPVVDFKGTVPVQNAPAPTGGSPATGAVPNSSGSDTGGTAPITIGHYPGNSGNGTIDNPTQNNPGSNGSEGRNGSGSGTGNIDTSGLAQESSLQSLGGLVTQIRDSLGGSVSGSAFTATTPGPHNNVNLSPEVTAKQTELSTKLSQVKAEFGQLLSFGSSTNAQALQCPANSGFTFYGTTISLCTQSVLSATATIGNVLIFLAFVVSLFILLS